MFYISIFMIFSSTLVMAQTIEDPIYQGLTMENESRRYSDEQIHDLLYSDIDLRNYKDGIYELGITLYLFCRDDRSYPCLFLLRDRHGRPVRTNEGELWSLPALALSKYGLAYDQVNGNTPQGIHYIHSVMPLANKTEVYGEYRRLILNWVENEENTLHLIPSSLQSAAWWREAETARDNGRDLLRIHGTGGINSDPKSKHYSFVATSGCVSTREGMYEGEQYHDQRTLLDALMVAMDLDPNYENEEKLLGLLYVINLDNDQGPVNLETLRDYGID